MLSGKLAWPVGVSGVESSAVLVQPLNRIKELKLNTIIKYPHFIVSPIDLEG